METLPEVPRVERPDYPNPLRRLTDIKTVSDFVAELERMVSLAEGASGAVPAGTYAEALRLAHRIASHWEQERSRARQMQLAYLLATHKRRPGRPRKASGRDAMTVVDEAFAAPAPRGRKPKWTAERAKAYLEMFDEAKRELESRKGCTYTERQALRLITKEFREGSGKPAIATSVERVAGAIQKNLDRARKVVGAPPLRRSRRKVAKLR